MLKQLIISSIAFAAAAQGALAQEPGLPSVKVSLAGIDARTDAGAQIMLRRIKLAAGQVCGGQPSPMIDRQQKFEPCVNEVTQRTVTGLNSPHLTAAWNKRIGVEPATQVAARAR